jgi:hypothetical protein
MTPWGNRVVSYRGNNVKLAKKEKKTKKKGLIQEGPEDAMNKKREKKDQAVNHPHGPSINSNGTIAPMTGAREQNPLTNETARRKIRMHLVKQNEAWQPSNIALMMECYTG